jgi:hypothetical protein
MNIKGFRLKNDGGFVARIHVVYRIGTAEEQTKEIGGDVLLGQEKEVIFGEHDIPEGSIVKLKAHIVWGTDNVAKQAFTYKKDATKVVRYVTSGTTLNNSLGAIELS